MKPSINQTGLNQTGCLGILAGAGELPWMAARNARNSGENVRLFLGVKSAVPGDLRSITEEIFVTRLYSSLIPALKNRNVDRFVVLGKFNRELLYNKGRIDFRLKIGLFFWKMSQSDYSLFRFLETVLKKYSITILPQTLFLRDYSLREGRCGRRLSERELQDVAFGMLHGRMLSGMDIGQTVVVGSKCVLAVEAAEGSDRCIERGGKIFIKKGAVVCKTARKGHDMRNDIPTLGTSTLDVMQSVFCQVIAFDSETTIIIRPKEFIKKAKENRISILSINPDKIDKTYLKQLNSSESSLL